MESPFTINQWAEQTFGPRSAYEAAVRANVEMAELLSGIVNKADVAHIGGEIADVFIVICQVPEILGLNLVELLLKYKPNQSTSQAQKPSRIANSLNVHMAMLLESLFLGDFTSSKLLIVAVVRDIERLASKYKINLADEIDAKMVINRARNWGKTENGRFQHT